MATRAKVMTGNTASKMPSEKVRQANREYDAMDRREGKGQFKITHFSDKSDNGKN